MAGDVMDLVVTIVGDDLVRSPSTAVVNVFEALRAHAGGADQYCRGVGAAANAGHLSQHLNIQRLALGHKICCLVASFR